MKLVQQAITPFCVEANRLDLYEKALSQMLPYSFHDYEFFFLIKKNMKSGWSCKLMSALSLASISSDRIKLLQC